MHKGRKMCSHIQEAMMQGQFSVVRADAIIQYLKNIS